MKTSGETVRGMLDLVLAKTSEAKSDKEVDRLRKMAESVQQSLISETLVRAIGEADEPSLTVSLIADNDVSAKQASNSLSPAKSDTNPAAANTSSAFSRQKQAYRENA